MSGGYDYSEFEGEKLPVGENAQARLEGIASEFLACEARIETLKEQLKEAEVHYNDIRLKRLPELMDEIGSTDFTTQSGIRLSMHEEIRAGIKEDLKEDAHSWLEENGHGNLIKREFKIEFGRDDESWARKFMADCKKRKRQLNLTLKRAVNNQTLGAFVRKQLEEGALDSDAQTLLGVFRQRFAKVKLPKESK